MTRLKRPLTQATLAFCAGLLAGVLFFGGAWALASGGGAALSQVYLRGLLPPWVPSIVTSGLMGGVGAMVLGHLLRGLRPGLGYWLVWGLVGAVGPLAILWLLLLVGLGSPILLEGRVIALLLAVNAGWGLGTAALLRLFGVQRADAPLLQTGETSRLR